MEISLGFPILNVTHKIYLAMFFIQFVYSGMALFSKAAIGGGMNPFVFVVYRQAFATLALTPFTFTFLLERKKAPPMSYYLLCQIFFVSLCGITLSLNLYSVALNYTTATMASASNNTVPVITFIMAIFLRMESISVKHKYGVAKLVGSVTCVSGAMLVALYKGPPVKFLSWYSSTHKDGVSSTDSTHLTNGGGSQGEWIKGALIMLAANTAWSFLLIMQGRIIKGYPSKIRLTNLQCFFSCIQSAIWAIVVERNPSSWKLGWDVQLLSVAYCGIIVTGITFWLQVWCIEKKGPVFTAMFTPLALLITAIFSTIMWKETIHWGSVSGALLLVGGLYSVLWGKKKEEATNKTQVERQEETKEDNMMECITHQ